MPLRVCPSFCKLFDVFFTEDTFEVFDNGEKFQGINEKVKTTLNDVFSPFSDTEKNFLKTIS